jgi:ABC-type lipoprotein release transport system permease subunit
MVLASKYALRSLSRHSRRTWLSIVGIAVGCALALVMESMNRGRQELFGRIAPYGGAGHIRIVPAGWQERRDPRLRLADPDRALTALDGLRGVSAFTRRARTQALVAMGTHVVAVEIVGVDPATEPATYRFVRRIARGRYLRPADANAVVVGQAIADRLDADLEDEILATAVAANGEIGSMLLRIVGIVATGSDEIDATICQVPLGDVATLTGTRGPGEITVILDDWQRTAETRASLAAGLTGGDQALTWGEISPEFEGHLQQDTAVSRLVSLIILLIVVLGVASAQLAAVLERRREFAILSALGMRGRTLTLVLVEEATIIGAASALLGLILGGPPVWWLARYGLDLSRYLGSSYTFQGVFIEPVIYGDFGGWLAWYAVTVALAVTTAASLYPAWFASRTNPADGLRVA